MPTVARIRADGPDRPVAIMVLNVASFALCLWGNDSGEFPI